MGSVRRIACAAAAAAAFVLASPRTHAAPAPVTLTRERAAELGATQGPGVAVERAPRAAVDDARRAANPLLVVPPRVTISGGQRTGSFGSGVEVAVTAIEDVPLRGVGRERARTAEALRASTDRAVENAELDAGTRAALAWASVVEAKHTLALRTASLRDADELLRVAKARVGSGVGFPFEIASAQGDRGAAAALALDAEGVLTEALFELRYATGLPADAPVDVAGELEPAPGEAERTPAGDEHPSVRAAMARATLAEQEGRMAYAARAPFVGVGASYLHEGTGNQVWSGVISVPLPVGDFGAFDRARQDAVASRVRAEVNASRQQLERNAQLALHERRHARETYEALVQGARAPLTEALRLARVQYVAGNGDLASVLLAWQRLYAAEEQVTRAAANVLRADIRLAHATATRSRRAP